MQVPDLQTVSKMQVLDLGTEPTNCEQEVGTGPTNCEQDVGIEPTNCQQDAGTRPTSLGRPISVISYQRNVNQNKVLSGISSKHKYVRTISSFCFLIGI